MKIQLSAHIFLDALDTWSLLYFYLFHLSFVFNYSIARDSGVTLTSLKVSIFLSSFFMSINNLKCSGMFHNSTKHLK